MSAANFTMMDSFAGGHKEAAGLTEVQPGRQRHFPSSEFSDKKNQTQLTFKDPKITSTARMDLLRDFITARS